MQPVEEYLGILITNHLHKDAPFRVRRMRYVYAEFAAAGRPVDGTNHRCCELQKLDRSTEILVAVAELEDLAVLCDEEAKVSMWSSG